MRLPTGDASATSWRPTGEESALRSVAKRLAHVARTGAGTDVVSGNVRHALSFAWSGPAASAAQGELAILGSRGGAMAEGLSAAAAALGAYADAVARARLAATGLERERVSAWQEHSAGVAKAQMLHAQHPAALHLAVERLDQEHEARGRRLERRTDEAREELERAALRCAATLEAAQTCAGSPAGPLAPAGDLGAWMLHDLHTVERVEHLSTIAQRAAADLGGLQGTLSARQKTALMSRYAQWSSDSLFAAMLLRELGPQRAAEVGMSLWNVGVTDDLGDPGAGGRRDAPGPTGRLVWARLLQAGMSDSGAGVTSDFMTEMLREVERTPDGLLRFAILTRDHGPSATSFALPFAEAAYAADRSGAFLRAAALNPDIMNSPADPMVSVMRALQRNPGAALAFFDPHGELASKGSSERLDHLLTDRVWGGGGDDGESRGAVETYAAIAGVTNTWPHEQQPAALASLVVRLIATDDAARDTKQHTVPPEAREWVARLLAPYARDLAFTEVGSGESRLVDSVRSEWPDRPDEWSPLFRPVQRDLVLHALGRSPEAYETLSAVLRKVQIDLYLEQIGKAGHIHEVPGAPLSRLRTVADGYADELLQTSKAEDTEHNERVDAVTETVTGLIGDGASAVPFGKALGGVGSKLAEKGLGKVIELSGSHVSELLHRDSSKIIGTTISTGHQSDVNALVMDAWSLEWVALDHHQIVENPRFRSFYVDGDPARPKAVGDIMSKEPAAWSALLALREGLPLEGLKRELVQSYLSTANQPTTN